MVSHASSSFKPKTYPWFYGFPSVGEIHIFSPIQKQSRTECFEFWVTSIFFCINFLFKTAIFDLQTNTLS